MGSGRSPGTCGMGWVRSCHSGCLRQSARASALFYRVCAAVRWHEGWRAEGCWGSRLSGGQKKRGNRHCGPSGHQWGHDHSPELKGLYAGGNGIGCFGQHVDAVSAECAGLTWSSYASCHGMTFSASTHSYLSASLFCQCRTGKRRRFGPKQRAQRGAGGGARSARFGKVQDGKEKEGDAAPNTQQNSRFCLSVFDCLTLRWLPLPVIKNRRRSS